MKKTVKYFILTIIICISILPLSISYIKYKINNVNSSCTTEVEMYIRDIVSQKNNIKMSEYLDIDCDGFYVISPYTTTSYKHEIVGQEWYQYNSYGSYLFNEILFDGDNLTENQQLLAFVNGGKVVSIAILDRKNGDFLMLKEKYYDINTIFTAEVDDNGYYRITVFNLSYSK